MTLAAFITSLYLNYLGHAPDAATLALQVSRALAAHSVTPVVDELVGGPEFAALHPDLMAELAPKQPYGWNVGIGELLGADGGAKMDTYLTEITAQGYPPEIRIVMDELWGPVMVQNGVLETIRSLRKHWYT